MKYVAACGLVSGFLLLAGCAKEPSDWTKTDVMIPAR